MADKFRHRTRGGIYEIVGNASLQNAGMFNLREGDNLVIYRGEDGRLWARPHVEFYDGRFEPVKK